MQDRVKNSRVQQVIELFLLFLMLPIILSMNVPSLLKVTIAITTVGYLVWLMRKNQQWTATLLFAFGTQCNWRAMLLRFCVFAVISAVAVYHYLPNKFFVMPQDYPLMWAAISLFYVVFSVYPQEIIYRQFFFWRYRGLVNNSQAFITLNAVLFCLAHLMFWNNWVLALTLAGGFLFSHTFSTSRSVMFTSIEHSLYGLWLFTIGVGEMLAFPMPSS